MYILGSNISLVKHRAQMKIFEFEAKVSVEMQTDLNAHVSSNGERFGRMKLNIENRITQKACPSKLLARLS